MQKIYRNGIVLYDVVFGSSSSVTRKVMEVDEFSLSFRHSVFIEIERGDYTIVDNKKFIFVQKPSVKLLSTQEYEYSATLKDESVYLENSLFLFLDYDSTGTTIYASNSTFDLTATISEFLSLICTNLKRLTGKTYNYSVDSSIDANQTYNLAFSEDSCKQALDSICDEAEIEWQFDGEAIKVSKRIEKKTKVELSYPTNLLSPFEAKSEDSNEYCNRLYVFGSERNIPSDYNDGHSQRLLMRGKTEYMQRQGVGTIIEKVKTFDEVYPRRNSSISAVRKDSNGFYFVTDWTIDFNIKEQLEDGKTAKISFTSGYLIGYEFEIASYDHANRTIEIKQQTDSGIIVPNDSLKPNAGDSYVLLDIVMPSQYVVNAEEELYEKALEYFEKECNDSVSTNVELSSIWAMKNNVKLNPYDVVRLKDDNLKIDESIRINSVKTYPFDGETYGRKQEIELSNFVKKSKLKVITGKVGNLGTQVVNNYTTINNTINDIKNETNNIGDSLEWKQGIND